MVYQYKVKIRRKLESYKEPNKTQKKTLSVEFFELVFSANPGVLKLPGKM